MAVRTDLGMPTGPLYRFTFLRGHVPRELGERIGDGSLRPDWRNRGFLRGYTDERYSFGRYFSPLEPNRPTNLDDLFSKNDVVLYDRQNDPPEVVNLAADPAHHSVVADYSDKLECLIDAELGSDTRDWVSERPTLLGWPTWHGDRTAPNPV